MATETLTEPQRLWVEALRSGKYKQTERALCRLEDGEPVGYCCLGVACEEAVKAGVELGVVTESQVRSFAGETLFLPPAVRDWLGLATLDGRFGLQSADGLAVRNDSGATFDEIAVVIESRPSGLFA